MSKASWQAVTPDDDLLKWVEKTLESQKIQNKVMSKEIPVEYNGEIVGYTTDEGKTIQFNDSDASKKVNEMLNQKQMVWVSSRAIGEIKSDNTVEEKEKISYDISHFGNKQ
jgi:hypothetical protein